MSGGTGPLPSVVEDKEGVLPPSLVKTDGDVAPTAPDDSSTDSKDYWSREEVRVILESHDCLAHSGKEVGRRSHM